MATPASSPLSALRQRLDDTATALARADLEQLVSCEAQLQTALAALASSWPIAGDRAHLMADLEHIRTSLVRCRRLGGSLMDFVQTSLDGIGGPTTHTFHHSA
jgi:hypothetical protein